MCQTRIVFNVTELSWAFKPNLRDNPNVSLYDSLTRAKATSELVVWREGERGCLSCWSSGSLAVRSGSPGGRGSLTGSHWCRSHHWAGVERPPLRSRLSSETRSSRAPAQSPGGGGRRGAGWEERSEGNLSPALSQPWLTDWMTESQQAAGKSRAATWRSHLALPGGLHDTIISYDRSIGYRLGIRAV